MHRDEAERSARNISLYYHQEQEEYSRAFGVRTGKTDGRSYTKVIKMVKNPQNGSYSFDEQMVPNEAVKDFFKN